MPRVARVKKGEYCTYHIIERGNGRKEIFLEDKDRFRFLDTLQKTKKKYNYKIYAYCLMGNHVHLIADSNGSDISQIMKSINISYAIYFNRKYKRSGHLFQDRFKSEVVDDYRYLVELSRYIHLNPVRAKIVKNPADYKWSSYAVYVGNKEDKLLDPSLILGYFSGNSDRAMRDYQEYVKRDFSYTETNLFNPEITFEQPPPAVKPLTRKEIEELIKTTALTHNLNFKALSSKKTFYSRIRNKLIKEIRQKSNLNLVQIGEIFGGLSESAVSKIITKE